jgi:cell wall-associated NlpC family hydrolase
MKLQGDRYGWGGDLQANDCTGIVREIYRCFGILMPRVGQSDVTGVYWVDMSDMENDEKMDIIRDLAPGSLISFPGHMTIYLGTVDDIPYVISAVGTFMPPAGFSTEVLHPRTVVVSSLLVRTRSYNSWLSIAKTALTIKPE